ncbi:Methane monooxygenase [Patulibacter medicamentivorans]|uniref:propane 2-monooxygenase n=2 Tax=Patulibacter medicamentivorans TaxID=1097667 RepID=H0E7Y1_9ACTN|nr:Methane monooxygenase [Patulibacter medicamentivorans]
MAGEIRAGERRQRRGEDPERQFQWVVPAGRKASIYEDLTLDTQPSVHRFLKSGYHCSFADGRGTWDDASTALDVVTWSAFRDPNELWERPYYQQGAQCEREIDAAVESARSQGLYADVDPDWVAFLRRDGQVPAFVEHGIWAIATRRSRAALSDALTHGIVLYAAIKQRQAQALVIEGMDLDDAFGDVTIEAARERWLREPAWQDARRLVERMGTIRDWGELIVVAGLVVEPLLGVLLRRELLLRGALRAADPVTPAIARNAQREGAWWQDFAVAFARFAVQDPEHGAANRVLVDGWLEAWTPETLAAVDALEPILDGAPGTSFADARAAVVADQRELVAAATLDPARPAVVA